MKHSRIATQLTTDLTPKIPLGRRKSPRARMPAPESEPLPAATGATEYSSRQYWHLQQALQRSGPGCTTVTPATPPGRRYLAIPGSTRLLLIQSNSTPAFPEPVRALGLTMCLATVRTELRAPGLLKSAGLPRPATGQTPFQT